MKSIAFAAPATVCVLCSEPASAQAAMSADALQLKTLYEQLQSFKDDPEFHDVGYGTCCRFHTWLHNVTALQTKSGPKLFLEVGVLPGDLFELGQEYMRSKGQPTSYTQIIEPSFKAGLYR